MSSHAKKKKATPITRQCLRCGESYKSIRPTQKFCSHRCRQAAYMSAFVKNLGATAQDVLP